MSIKKTYFGFTNSIYVYLYWGYSRHDYENEMMHHYIKLHNIQMPHFALRQRTTMMRRNGIPSLCNIAIAPYFVNRQLYLVNER